MTHDNNRAIGPKTAAIVALLGAGTPMVLAAPALTGHMVTTAQLHAGPDTEYPRVTVLRPGAVFRVHGCETGYTWCDVEFGSERGWVDAAYIQADSSNGPVIVAKVGAQLGIPITAFDLNTYWQAYYRGRPWFVHRERYLRIWNRNPHGRPPPAARPAASSPPSDKESGSEASPTRMP
jgi:uncharacterized protein YraI